MFGEHGFDDCGARWAWNSPASKRMISFETYLALSVDYARHICRALQISLRSNRQMSAILRLIGSVAFSVAPDGLRGDNGDLKSLVFEG
jgi:hypothetical protein